MSSLGTSAVRRPSAWIVSPLWDMAYLVATPLAIVPAVLILSRFFLTPEEIALAAISFASLGHHLPGFMRAYGEHDLFKRFRWRFLLMPPIIFGFALLFSPPSYMANAMNLQWQHLHGLELILLLWGTWHGLMQTYGFLRIYDVKRGADTKRQAWLDQTLCFFVFVAGYIFSDSRVYGTADVMWSIGFPVFGAQTLWVVRMAVGIALSVSIVSYLIQLAVDWKAGKGVCWVKVFLISMTGWFYWFTGSITTNLLIGLAMFEIYHAIQYDAIVWVYNRQAKKRVGKKFGLLGFLFRDRWTMLGIYIACIALFGYLRYSTVNAAEFTFHGGDIDTHKLLIAFFVTSTIMHFYMDGFIWKVREPETKKAFVDEVNPSGKTLNVSGLWHGAKWAIFFAFALGMLFAEQSGAGINQADTTARLARLQQLTPNLPELRTQLSRNALDNGQPEKALAEAKAVLAERPHSHSALGDTAVALMALERHEEAVLLLQKAIEIEPGQWRYHTNLGLCYETLRKNNFAEKEYRKAIALRPDLDSPKKKLALFLLKTGQSHQAAKLFGALVSASPNNQTMFKDWIGALTISKQFDKAISFAEGNIRSFEKKSKERTSTSDYRRGLGERRLLLGITFLQAKKYQEAAKTLSEATECLLSSGEAWRQLGIAQYQLGWGERERSITD